MSNLFKPVLINSKEEKFVQDKDNIWTSDLPEMELLSSKNKNAKYLLRVIDVLNKYACDKSLKDKKRWNSY